MDYHSGARFKGKKVLLVGFGNSANDVSAAAPGLFETLKEACSKKDAAAQVCCDLWEEGAETSVVIRSPVSLVPRSLWMCTPPPRSRSRSDSYSSCASTPLCSFPSCASSISLEPPC